MSCCKECEDKGPDVTCAPCGQPQPRGMTYSTAAQRAAAWGNRAAAGAEVAPGDGSKWSTPAEHVSYDLGVTDGRNSGLLWGYGAGVLTLGAVWLVLSRVR